MAAKQISLKLLVHKEQNQVIYAESGKDFVDDLFSFLTMPVGTAVRLAGKQSKMGSMSTLYESVEDLDIQFLQTEACKDMLLHPKSAAEEWCKNLKVDIDDTKPTHYYGCSQGCYGRRHHLISTVDTARCLCGSLMNRRLTTKKPKLKNVACGEDGVFVKGKTRYMIRDDLQVSPVSTTESLTLLKKLGISDVTGLEERDVNVGAGEVLHLLKCLLLSKTPLTDVFLPGQDTIDRVVDQDFKVMSLDSKDMAQSLTEKESGSDSKKMSVKLFMSKSKKKVLYAECGEEFPELLFSFLACPLGSIVKVLGGFMSKSKKKMSVKLFMSKSKKKVLYAECGEEFPELLFSFLAFPLGSIVKVLGGFASLNCLNNLYSSVELLSINDCIIFEESKDMLLDPKLAPYFSCDMQPIQIQEQVPRQLKYMGCIDCMRIGLYDVLDDIPTKCPHGLKGGVQLSTINPKYPNVVKELGGAFTAGPEMFMVTDELNVKPSSPIVGISLLSKYNVSISDLEEQVASVGEEEALSLLAASLISRTALTDVFILKKPKQFAVGSDKRRYTSERDVKTEFLFWDCEI